MVKKQASFKGDFTLLAGIDVFMYMYIKIRLELHFLVLNVYIFCTACFGEFVPESFIYLLCKH